MDGRRSLLVAACALVAAAACSGSDPGTFDESSSAPPAQPGATASEAHTHDLDVDWIQFSEGQLYAASRAIVRGKVVAQREGQHRTYPFDAAKGRELSPEEAGDEYAELPLTISVIEVHERMFASGDARALRDEAIDPGSRIEVVQIGGHYEHGCFVTPNDQPLLARGEDVVVYLKAGMIPHLTKNPAGMYSIIGGKQGLIRVHEGLAAPLADTVFTRYAKKPIADLTREIRAISSP